MRCLLLSIMLLFYVFVNAQNYNSVVGDIVTIYFKDGNVVKGTITWVGEHEISFKYSSGSYVASYNKDEISRIEKIQFAKKGSVGVGIGVPYGILGFNGELAVHNNLSLSAGFGTSVVAGIAYACGIRAYLKPTGEKWRPRVSIHYGINSMIADADLSSGESFAGLNIGAGILGMFGERRKSGFDLAINYFVTRGGFDDRMKEMNDSGMYQEIKDPGRIRLIVGYRYGF